LPARIHDDIRQRVISQWISGQARDRIAKINGLGTGTVSSIVKQFKLGLRRFEIESVRELTGQMRKNDISIKECALAVRLISRIKRLNGKVSAVEQFVSDVQTKCLNTGLLPEKTGELLAALFSISRAELIPIEQVPDHLERKIKRLKLEYHSKRSAIHTMSLLLGVDDKEVLKWDKILERHKDVMSLESLADDLERYGSMRTTLTQLDLRVKELIKQETWSREEIDLLKQQKDHIELAISILQKKTINSIERVQGVAIQAITSVANAGETSVATTTQSHNPQRHFKDKQEEPTLITYEVQTSK
jgi:energy-converting hydrogenase A subunit M